MTPDVKLNARNHDGEADGEGPDQANKSDLLDDEEDFFDFISRFQSKRMDDQRCSLSDLKQETVPVAPMGVGPKDDLLDLIAGAQSCRLNEQRAPWNVLPGLNRSKQPEILQRLSVATTDKDSLPDDNFFEQLMKMQGTRIEDQRSSLPGVEQPPLRASVPAGPPTLTRTSSLSSAGSREGG